MDFSDKTDKSNINFQLIRKQIHHLLATIGLSNGDNGLFVGDNRLFTGTVIKEHVRWTKIGEVL